MHPIEVVGSLGRGRESLLPDPEFSGLEETNLIDFHLLFFFSLVSPSPLTVRDFSAQ